MSGTLQARLAGVGDSRVRIVDWDVPVEGGDSPIVVRFENGARLHATYWRLIKHEKAALSSFDDRQRYGLAAPIDARAVLRSELDDRRCTAIRFDGVTGDLLLDFTEGPRLQVFTSPAMRSGTSSFPTAPSSTPTTHRRPSEGSNVWSAGRPAA